MKAWSASDADLSSAASYFAGVCADFIPQNPQICPGTITLQPVPVQTAQGNAPQPMTTVQVVNTVTVTKGKPSVVTQMITVPQVQFITATPTPVAVVTEAGAAPAPAPTPSVGLFAAQTGAAAAAPSGVAAASSYYTIPSASATFASPATFTGAAAKKEIGFGVVAGVLAGVAFFA